MSTRITTPSDHRCVICGEGVRSKRTPLLKYTEESAMHIAVENYLDELVAFAATDWEARLRKLVLDWAPTGDYLSRVLKRCRTWSAASGALLRREHARRNGEYHVAHENCRLGSINACDMFVPRADLPRNPSKSSKPAVHEAWKRSIGAVLSRPPYLDASPESMKLGRAISRLGRQLVPRPRSEAKRKGPVTARRNRPLVTLPAPAPPLPLPAHPTLAPAGVAAAAAPAPQTPRFVRAADVVVKKALPSPTPTLTPTPITVTPSGPAGNSPRPRRMSLSLDPTNNGPMLTRKRSRTASFASDEMVDITPLKISVPTPLTGASACGASATPAGGASAGGAAAGSYAWEEPPVTVKEEPVWPSSLAATAATAASAAGPFRPMLQALTPQTPTLSPKPSLTNIAGLASPTAFLTPPRPSLGDGLPVLPMPMEHTHSTAKKKHLSPSDHNNKVDHADRTPLRRRYDNSPPQAWELSPEMIKGLAQLGLAQLEDIEASG